MDYIDYREKLGLAFNDNEKQQFFVTRVFTYLNNSSAEFSHKNEIDFCYATSLETYAESKNPNFEVFNISFNEPVGMKKVAYYLNQRKKDFRDFLATLVMFLNTYGGKKSEKEKLWNDFEKMFQDSHIQYELLNDSGKTFIFPKGAKELDKAVVSEPLEWLSVYQTSQKAFSKALELYADSSDSNASDVADAFRKSLETFFQEFFNSDKSLENLKSEYGQFLKNCNVPAEISNNFQSLLNSYALFMNNYAKHHDKTSKNILEYIMYQTGNIIRLLITLKNEAERLCNE